MKRFLYILSFCISLALSAGCEFEFDVDVKTDPGLYMQCMVDESEGQIFLNLQYAAPVKSGNKGFPELKIRRIEVTVDGETQEVVEGEGCTYKINCNGALKAGQIIKAKAEAEGMAAVEATTVLEGGVSLKSLEMEVDSLMVMELHNLTVELEDQPQDGEFIAVRIERTDWFESEGDNEGEEGRLDSTTVSLRPMIVNTDTEIETAQVCFNGMRIVENGDTDEMVTILPARAFRQAKVTLPIVIMPDWSEMADTQMPAAEDEEKEEEQEILRSEYRVTVYKVSESFYRYSIAVDKSQHDFMAIMGLAPANFAWSNVAGGFGVCASYSASATTLSVEKPLPPKASDDPLPPARTPTP